MGRLRGFNPHTHTGCDPSYRRTTSVLDAVSIHTPIQGVTLQEFSFHQLQWVSIHTPIQGVTRRPSPPCRGASVSIHTPIQGVTWLKRYQMFISVFQSTHPYRVWHTLPMLNSPNFCFNPHTHTGCDRILYVFYLVVSVSIHTPIQGVTTTRVASRRIPSVSIHTPIQGVTASVFLAVGAACFNPHTHTGCDIWICLHVRQQRSFNPHTHTGCDYRRREKVLSHTRFNPHTHTGCDCMLSNQGRAKLCFNPHTHTGCDISSYLIDSRANVSIHTPIQGVTASTSVWRWTTRVSIHTPIQGVTFHSQLLPRAARSFNPHTHTGCDAWRKPCTIYQDMFQSTHPYRVWLWRLQGSVSSWCFNPHTHTGCDTEQRFIERAFKFQSTHPYRVWPYAWVLQQSIG